MVAESRRLAVVGGEMGVGRVVGVGVEGCSAKPFSPPLFSLSQSPSSLPQLLPAVLFCSCSPWFQRRVRLSWQLRG